MRVIFISFLIFVTSCSSVKRMRGTDAQLINGDSVSNLKITAELDKQISVEKYRLINIYFRNLNENWLRVKNVEVVEVSNNQQFNVILGDDLSTWLSSMKLNQDLLKEKEKDKTKIKSLKNYTPKEHIYSRFSIPSQLQTSKWLLLQLTEKQASWMKLKIEFIDGTEQTYKVIIK